MVSAPKRSKSFVHRRACAGLAAALLLSACGNQNGPAATADTDPDHPTTRTAAPPRTRPGDSSRSVYESAAVDLQALFEKLQPAASGAAAADASPPRPQPGRAGPQPAPTPDEPPAVALDTPPAPTSPSPQATAREKRLEYARQLAQLLVPAGEEAKNTLRAALPLIALETIQPGVATAELDRLVSTLSEPERQTIGTVRRLMAQIEALADTGADPKSLADAIRTEVDKSQPKPAAAPPDLLALGTVALCRKVEAFGRFTPYPGSSFVAGRKVPMIVYTEVENYTQARESELPATGAAARPASNRWALELSQEVHLYSSDGTLVWFAKEQTHRDASQSKRRDFFLVQRIDLPSALSVGRYSLKVIVRDKAAAALTRGAEPLAEVNIPISVVADNAVAASDTIRPVASGHAGATAAVPERP